MTLPCLDSPVLTKPILIRTAIAQDTAEIVGLIRELADYEQLRHACVITEEQLHQSLFSATPVADTIVVEEAGKLVGFALYYFTYSTFNGKKTLYLEDLFVQASYRGQGLGKALLLELVKLAQEKGCGRLQWRVLDWNKPSIDFYKSLGAVPMHAWTVFRLDEQAMSQLQ